MNKVFILKRLSFDDYSGKDYCETIGVFEARVLAEIALKGFAPEEVVFTEEGYERYRTYYDQLTKVYSSETKEDYARYLYAHNGSKLDSFNKKYEIEEVTLNQIKERDDNGKN